MLHADLIAPIPDLLKRHARERGTKVAYRDAQSSVTYAQLDERTARLAAHLADHGIAAGDTVAILLPNSTQWVETCFCPTPLAEEREYWEEYFVLEKVQDAHARSRCRDLNGTEPWACCDCDCTDRLESHLSRKGQPFERCLPLPSNRS